jgi:formylglycine-generating enzyme required for sulfatase activity
MRLRYGAIIGLALAWAMGQAGAEPAPTPAAVLTSDVEQALKPKDVFKDCPDCPEMVVIPAGNFLMGRKDASPRSNEGPQHEVVIAKPFAAGRFSITFEEWHKCATAGGCHYNPSEISRRPAVVTWQQAKNYVAWLSKLTGEPYRLLSEAEREYVTRAGTTTIYNTGDTITHDQAWFSNFYYDAKESKPVGSFPPNAFGAYDTHGNMWEWVEDCWHRRYNGAPAGGSAWTEKGDCDWHVLRGGFWGESLKGITSATRWYGEAAPQVGSGFRVARALAQ